MVLSLLASIIIHFVKNDLTFKSVIIVALVFLIGPYLLAFYMKFLKKLFRRPVDDKSFFEAYLIIWAGSVIFGILKSIK